MIKQQIQRITEDPLYIRQIAEIVDMIAKKEITSTVAKHLGKVMTAHALLRLDLYE